MNTDNLISTLKQYIKLTDEESTYFLSLTLPMRVHQGEMLEKLGEPTKYFIHVVSGCLMSYHTDKEGTDHVLQFAQAGWWTGDLASYTTHVGSTITTRALTDSEVLLLPQTSMDQLLEKLPQFERYFRILFQKSLITHGNRLIQNLSVSAEERYLAFQKKYPPLEQYVPLKYIASYLGITPEFLSKIRRKLMSK